VKETPKGELESIGGHARKRYHPSNLNLVSSQPGRTSAGCFPVGVFAISPRCLTVRTGVASVRANSLHPLPLLPQELLGETSRGLHALTGGRAMFGSVVVNLPRAWAGSECSSGATSTGANGQREDFRVSGADRTRASPGPRPRAVQHGGCGMQGLRVDLPHPALTENATLSPLVIRGALTEWLRSHFGVFPERGFHGDSLYPAEVEEGGILRAADGCPDTAEDEVRSRHIQTARVRRITPELRVVTVGSCGEDLLECDEVDINFGIWLAPRTAQHIPRGSRQGDRITSRGAHRKRGQRLDWTFCRPNF